MIFEASLILIFNTTAKDQTYEQDLHQTPPSH